MAAMLDNQPKVEPAFKTGPASLGATRRPACSARSRGSSARATTTIWSATWLPALDGVVAKLESGAKVADVGCGHGVSTVMMAQAFPNSQFVGYDFHPSSIEHAQAMPASMASAPIAASRSARRRIIRRSDFDLVAFFDCLHDMGDPAGAAAHVRHP